MYKCLQPLRNFIAHYYYYGKVKTYYYYYNKVRP